jgi:predicted nucleic acid-binding protein
MRVLAGLVCEAIPEAAGDFYATLKTDCEAKGIATHENDLWIAATAMERGATLVSRDLDMHRLAGVSVEDWPI